MIYEYNLCDYRFKKSLKIVLIILSSLFVIVDLMMVLVSISFLVEGEINAGIVLIFTALFIAITFIFSSLILIFSLKNVRFQIYESKYIYVNFRKKEFIIEREGTSLHKEIFGKGCYYSIKKDDKILLRMFSLPNDEKFENELKNLGINIEI